MENIYNNYRSIVERAVLAGIITEDIKDFYLSAIDEENESDLSELENQLNKHEASHLHSSQKKGVDCTLQQKSDSIENCTNKNTGKQVLTNVTCLEENHSISGDTIENYSIFDFEHCKPSDGRVQESTSETSLSKPSSKTSAMIKKCASSSIIPQVMKKPRKNQIVDFNIPIYINTKKKRVYLKPDTSQYISSEEQNDKILKTRSCKYKRSKGGNREVQSFEKWPLNQQPSKEFSKEEHRNFALNSKSFTASEIFKQALKNLEAKENENDIQGANAAEGNCDYKYYTCLKTRGANKMGHTLSSEECNQEKNECCCRHETTGVNLPRKSRDCSNQMSKKSRHKMKVKEPVLYSNYRHTKNETLNVYKDLLENCKPCKHACASKTVHHLSNSNNSAETVSDDGTSMSSILVPSCSKRKEQDRQLNVNIYCQFYQTDEIEEVKDNKAEENPNDSKDKHSPIEEVAKNSIDTDDLQNKKPKSSPSRRITRLSNIFTNMRINRKQKKHS